MRRTADGIIAIVALIVLAIWVFVALPLIYEPAGTAGFWGWLSKDASGFFTFLLLIVAVGQLVLFWYQLRLIRVSLDEAKVAALAAKDSANAAIRQAAVAEASFSAIERPYIYIFGAKGLECDFDQEEPYDFLKYSIANYGKTPASIEVCNLAIGVGTVPPPLATVSVWHSLSISPILTPNEQRNDLSEIVPDTIKTNQYADEHTPPGSFTVPILEQGTDFFFWIQIKYDGPFSKGHETSACWRWDRSNDRLTLHGGEAFNYTR
jgi:hypothetical protein